MPAKNEDLHGNVPDSAPAALLLIDVVNDLEFDGGRRLLEHALPAAARIARLKARCKRLGIPAIYVNDNFGRWRSDFVRQVEHCLEDETPGKPLVEALLPQEDDYYVLKPKHSGFYQTPLDLLLSYLKARTLILTGFAGNFCVLFTAHDAFMRDYHLVVPSDCVASETEEANSDALRRIEQVLKADVRASSALDLAALTTFAASPSPSTH